MRKIRIGELFCGPGGLALGAQLASGTFRKFGYDIQHAWSVDNHIDSIETYRSNIRGANSDTALCVDVRNISAKKLLKISKIEAFAFGFPCNDFSVIGEHRGTSGKFGPLYTYGLPILELGSPLFFIAENVGGIRSANDGRAFKKILADLSNAGIGYNLTPHIYKFEDYGVPQARHRVIIVGIRKDLGIYFKPPAPTHQNDFKTCYDAIMFPPIPLSASNNEITRQSELVVERLKFIKPGENVWSAKLPKRLMLNVKKAKISQIYKRLDPKKPAYTVTGSGGGGTHVYHWSEPRALTNRERARLQTFPDNFVFKGSKGSVRRQIGMAVPPTGSKIIFEAIIKLLEGKRYRYVDANL
jgi:DNA (cytosine-5)-methyltransferase 1